MWEGIYCALQTLDLQGKDDEEPLARTAYVPFYSNKIKDKQDEGDVHLPPIWGHQFYENDEMKLKEDRLYQKISSGELLPFVPFCLLSS